MATKPSDNRDLVCLGPVKSKRGRPYGDTYDPEVGKVICERLAAGETLTGICADEDMPAVRTVSGWMMRHEQFFADIARAREQQMHLEAEQIREIADNAYEDYYIDYKDVDGVPTPYVVVNNESVKRAALRISARQWRAERLAKRFYAGTTKHEHTAVPAAPALKAGGLPEALGFLTEECGPDEN